MFVLRETLRSIRNTPATFMMSVVALAIAAGLAGLLVSAAYQATERLTAVRGNLKLEAFFDPAVASADAERIASERVRVMSGVSRIEVVTKEQALEDFKTSSGEDVQQILGINPLPASVRVYLRTPNSANAELAQTALEKIGGVATVKSDLPLLRAVESRTNVMEWIAGIFGGLCLIGTFFFLVLAARFTLQARTKTESVFTLLGATRTQIQLPLTIEALFVGALGGILAVLQLALLQRVILDRLGTNLISHSAHEFALLAAASILATILLSLSATKAARLTRRR
jgi:cell division transport system permease protein